MNVQVIFFIVLVTASCSSCHPPTRDALRPDSETVNGNHSVSGSNCVTVAYPNTDMIPHTRMKRARSGRMSLSPDPASPPSNKPDNTTGNNSTLPILQGSLRLPRWVPSLENVITPIFRTIILILTLFNVNITWRIHGQWPALP